MPRTTSPTLVMLALALAAALAGMTANAGTVPTVLSHAPHGSVQSA